MDLPMFEGPPPLGHPGLLDDVTSALRRDRWVSLVGPAGVGKSCLAAELLRARQTERCVVDLTEARSLPAVTEALSRALTVDASCVEDLGPHLARRGAITLLLDGLEVPGLPIDGWLRIAPAATVLVTTRARVGGEGEIVVEVPCLDVPSGDDPAEWEANPTVAWVRRLAGAAIPCPAIVAVVRKLRGHPLALRILAVRAGARLAEVAASLPSSPAGDPLEALRAWCWSLLDAPTRRAATRLTAFPAGFSAAAADEVAGEPVHHDALVELAFLRRVHALGGGVRFSIHDAARAFLVAQTSSADRLLAEANHARHYGGQAARALAALERGEPPDVSWGTLEAENLRVALDRGVLRGEASASAHAAFALLLLDRRRREAADDRLAQRGLAAAQASGDPALVAFATLLRGEVLRRRRLPEARAACVAVLETTHAAHRVAQALLARGALEVEAGALAAARASLSEVVGGGLRLHPRELARLELAFAELHLVEGSVAVAVACVARARALLARHPDAEIAGELVLVEARAHADLGAFAHAHATVVEALGGRPDARAGASILAGSVSLELERLAEARVHLEQAVALCEAEGLTVRLCAAVERLGWVELAENRPERAALCFRRAVAHARVSGATFTEAFAEASLAAVEASRGHLASAEAALVRARQVASRHEGPGLHLCIDVLFGLCEAARALRAGALGDATSAQRAREGARVRLEQARERPHGLELRLSIRALERALAVPLDGNASSLVLVRAPQVVVVDGHSIDLTRRPTLFRLLVALVGALRPMGVMELFEAAWPGERARPDAARNRVHVALSALRRLGLGSVIVSDRGRYSLEPRLTRRVVERLADAWAA